MIIKAFSEYLKENILTDNLNYTVEVLNDWLKKKLLREPESNIDSIIHTEISLIDNNGSFSFKGKSKTGRILLESLYNFALSYEQLKFTRWIHKIKASDFINYSK